MTEALIHLCAAGLAPRNVHILLVDADIASGNRRRAFETVQAYERLQQWPWLVRPYPDPKFASRLFASKVRVYLLAERLDDVNRVGLLAQIRGDVELAQAFRVLFDESELTSDLSCGFAGRPNLGSAVMDEYLRYHFSGHPDARAFLLEL